MKRTIFGCLLLASIASAAKMDSAPIQEIAPEYVGCDVVYVGTSSAAVTVTLIDAFSGNTVSGYFCNMSTTNRYCGAIYTGPFTYVYCEIDVPAKTLVRGSLHLYTQSGDVLLSESAN